MDEYAQQVKALELAVSEDLKSVLEPPEVLSTRPLPYRGEVEELLERLRSYCSDATLMQADTARRGIPGAAVRLAKKYLRKLIAWYVNKHIPALRTNAQVAELLARQLMRLNIETEARLRSLTSAGEHLAELGKILRARFDEFTTLAQADLNARSADLNARFADLNARFADLSARVTDLKQREQSRESMVEYLWDASRRLEREMGWAIRGTFPAEPKIEPIPAESLPKFPRGFDYLGFEERFRGSEVRIKARQAPYVEFFRGRKAVLDLGCGRGEFLELMRENGIQARGVDANEEMVERCKSRGLAVELADGVRYLADQADSSLDGIFACQLVEHLEPTVILKLAQLAYQKLAPAGIFVAETVNPYAAGALASFYLDPTHVRPVPPELLRFIMMQAGFSKMAFHEIGDAGTRLLDFEKTLESWGDYFAAAIRS